MTSRRRRTIAATGAAVLTLVPLGAVLYLDHQVEVRLAERLSCRLGDDLTVSVSPLRVARAAVGGSLGDVGVEAHAVPLGKGSIAADVTVDLQDVRRTGGRVAVDAATAEVRLPLTALSDHVGVPVAADGNRLVIGGGARSVVIEPTVDDDGLDFEVVDVEVAGYSLGTDVTRRLTERLGDRLTDRLGFGGLPDGLRPTGATVRGEDLVVTAEVDAEEMTGSGDAGCSR